MLRSEKFTQGDYLIEPFGVLRGIHRFRNLISYPLERGCSIKVFIEFHSRFANPGLCEQTALNWILQAGPSVSMESNSSASRDYTLESSVAQRSAGNENEILGESLDTARRGHLSNLESCLSSVALHNERSCGKYVIAASGKGHSFFNVTSFQKRTRRLKADECGGNTGTAQAGYVSLP